MAEINFDCPHCGQNLDAPEDMAGWALDCPNCGKKIKIPIPEGLEAPRPEGAAKPEDNATTGLIEDPSAGDFPKGSTVRIDVPEEYTRPEPRQRIVKIKRLR